MILSSLLPDGFRLAATGADTATGLLGLWGAMMAVMWAFYCLIFIVGIICFIIWIWLLIDCIQRKNFDSENDKLIWALVMLLTGILGSVIYYFLIKRKKDAKAQPAKGKEAKRKDG